MKQYLQILKDIQMFGEKKTDRTGIGTTSLFGVQSRYDLSEGFPLVTTKKTFLRGIIVELIWLIRGETNIKYLVDRNVHIWDEWPFQNYLKKNNLEEKYPKYSQERTQAKKDFIEKIKNTDAEDTFVLEYGELGPVYGRQWRNFSPLPSSLPQQERDKLKVDQLKNAVELIKNNPDSRRIIVSAWNPAQIGDMLLPPCHAFFQFNVRGEYLDVQLYQRSADIFLGVPFNIASYSALLILIAKITGKKTGTFVHTLGDAHIYNNLEEQVAEQLTREPFALPELHLKKNIETLEDIEQLEWEDFELQNYQCHPRITGVVAV